MTRSSRRRAGRRAGPLGRSANIKAAAFVWGVAFLASPLAQAAESNGEQASPLDVKIPVTVWAIASFLLVLFIIVRKLMPRITAALDERARAIREALQAAEKARIEAEAAMKKHQDDLEKARQEARLIIDEGKRDAERLKAKIVSDAQRESEEITARARREIDLAKQAALDDLYRQSVDLAFALTSRLVQKSIDTSEHQQLIQEQIQSFRGGAASSR
ncbi:MAG TPA: F0F1 ATP synthase subunit B [Planctomycetota bacterium]|nr:F0F1 ATP synthase subunit B [Planctomycetota bacterium]